MLDGGSWHSDHVRRGDLSQITNQNRNVAVDVIREGQNEFAHPTDIEPWTMPTCSKLNSCGSTSKVWDGDFAARLAEVFADEFHSVSFVADQSDESEQFLLIASQLECEALVVE